MIASDPLIALIPTSEAVRYLHTDHLQTPRLATNAQAQVIWRWEGTAFGSTYPNEDVDGDGKLTTVNLRFPGQYYDAESGLHYNWNRYYDPRVGRYVTSDPIGLIGGLNTYAYVRNNPLRYIDPSGLLDISIGAEASGHAAVAGLGIGGGVSIDENGTICVYATGSITVGLGVYAGAGFSVGGSQGLNETGLSRSAGIFLEGGGGIAAGTEVNISPDGAGAGKGFGGVGVGGAGGMRETGTAKYCFPKDDKKCKK